MLHKKAVGYKWGLGPFEAWQKGSQDVLGRGKWHPPSRWRLNFDVWFGLQFPIPKIHREKLGVQFSG